MIYFASHSAQYLRAFLRHSAASISLTDDSGPTGTLSTPVVYSDFVIFKYVAISFAAHILTLLLIPACFVLHRVGYIDILVLSVLVRQEAGEQTMILQESGLRCTAQGMNIYFSTTCELKVLLRRDT